METKHNKKKFLNKDKSFSIFLIKNYKHKTNSTQNLKYNGKQLHF